MKPKSPQNGKKTTSAKGAKKNPEPSASNGKVATILLRNPSSNSRDDSSERAFREFHEHRIRQVREAVKKARDEAEGEVTSGRP
jgi:hypothetical protein